MMLRDAKEDDKLDVLLLSRQFYKESSHKLTYHPKKVEQVVEMAIDRPDWCLKVIEKEGELVGFIIACVSTTSVSFDLVGCELAWFVLPEHRDGKAGLMLLKAYEDWCATQGCKFVTMSDISDIADLGKLYEKKGYTMVEKTYYKEI